MNTAAMKKPLLISLAAFVVGMMFTTSLANYATERQSADARAAVRAAGEQVARTLERELWTLIGASQKVAGQASAAGIPLDSLQMLTRNDVIHHHYGAVLAKIDGSIVTWLSDDDWVHHVPVHGQTGVLPNAVPALIGPYNLAAGTPAILAVSTIAPMYQSVKWAVVFIEFAELVERAKLESLVNNGFEYHLRHAAPISGTQRSIARSRATDLVEPVEIAVRAANLSWTLALAPRHGWPGRSLQWTYFPLAALLPLAAAVLLYELAKTPERVRAQHRSRIADLQTTNQRLLDEVKRRKEIERQLSFEAAHDSLTGLANRPHFLARLDIALQALRTGRARQVAVLLVGMDRFQHVNESLGRKGGDESLVIIGRRLDDSLRPSDTVARIAGDVFAILVEELKPPHDAEHVAELVRTAMADPVHAGGHELFVTASIGIRICADGYESPEEVVKNAETAMFAAKFNGGNQAASFDHSMREKAASTLSLETDMRHALTRQEFLLYYQPIVSLHEGAVVGAESLIRWQHPLEGTVSPGQFLYLAEANGMIADISRWVMRTACTQSHRWRRGQQAAENFYVSVNLSGRDLQDSKMCDHIAHILEETGMPPGTLRAEVAETVLMNNLRVAASLISRLREMGVPVMLDDFGTGYSSLSYVHRLEFDALKIDQSFVRRLKSGSKDERIVQAIVHLAMDLGISTVAEGVEEADQLERLRELGCDHVQGYLISRPLPRQSFEEFLRTQASPEWQGEPVGHTTRA